MPSSAGDANTANKGTNIANKGTNTANKGANIVNKGTNIANKGTNDENDCADGAGRTRLYGGIYKCSEKHGLAETLWHEWIVCGPR